MRRRAKPAKPKVEAGRLGASKSRRNDGSRVRDLETRLAEALEQRTATAEILRVISRSPTDVQPVFDAIARNAVALCGGIGAVVLRFDGGLLHLAGHHNVSPDGLARVARAYPRRPGRDFPPGRALLDRSVVEVPDLQAATEFAASTARQRGAGSQLAVPLLRGQEAMGVIGLARDHVGPFSPQQIEVLKTFADQAVIAIENARLFNETREALEQQTATSEILGVISRSPTDTQPVFDAIAESAARLCSANDAQVLRVEGETLRLVAAFGTPSMPTVRQVTRGHLVGRAVLDRQIVHFRDLAQALAEYPESTAARYGVQSALAVPLLREGIALGVIRVSRTEVQPFTDDQIALLKTFADQAVIAIENVRLFKELQTSNRGLTETLEQQTATSEILKVISSSPADVQPVFDIIAANARRLCGASFGGVARYDGALAHLVALDNVNPDGADAIRRAFPMPTNERSIVGRAIQARAVVQVSDVLEDPAYGLKGAVQAAGLRSLLGAPMLLAGESIGVIVVGRPEAGSLSDSQKELLKTFADQAVIAVENVRLFTELQEKNRALTEAHARVIESLEQQTATAEVLRVISGSPTDLQPVFDSMLQSAIRLLGGFGGAILLYDGSALHFGAVAGGRPQSGAEDWFRSIYPLPLDPDTPVGRAILERRMIQLPDTEESASQITREVARGFQFRAVVTVPMLREGSAIGTISITRATPGEFSERQVEVLQTFADQAVIAVENVRLFKELEASNREIVDKSRQLEVASQHKSEFLANMSHELRTPLNAIIGFSEVLGERMFGDLNEKQDEYLKDIHASGQHLLSLINDILDLSKIEAGRMELELTDFHLATALDSALALVRERAGRRGIALQMNVDDQLGQIQADERKVRQVVLNLLSNAIKFTPEGGRIEVAAVPRNGSVEVSVSDTGVGIALEDQEAVFEEFRQVGTAAKKVEGTGLGLTLCRKFVELHGGRIWVKSQLGAGSTFTFTIPVRHGE